MELVRLPVGKQAPVDTDCIRIEEESARAFKLTGSAMCVEDDEGDSVSLIETQLFATVEEAEQVGTAWAASIGVDRLFVSTGTLACPLETIEMD